MDQFCDNLIGLVYSGLTDTPLAEERKAALSQEVLSGIYAMAKGHDLVHLAAHGLYRNGLLDEKTELGKQYLRAYMTSVLRYERMHQETQRIYRLFEEQKIRFLPLKGTVLRKYYPEPWMRTSCDVDILVTEAELDRAVEALCGKLNYRCESRDSYDVSLYSPGGMHLELHFALMEKRFPASKYLEEVWKNVRPIEEGKYQCVMTDDLFYFHQVVHLAKHFVTSGCGIRLFLDLWILNHHSGFSPDGSYGKYLEELGLHKLEAEVRNLSEVWFSGKAHTQLTTQMQTYVLRSGVYGSVTNSVVTGQLETGGKSSYAMSRIFLPYERISTYYPVLKKKKYLVPLYQVKRWISVLREGSLKRALGELSANRHVDQADSDNIREMMSKLHLMDL